MPKLFVKLFLIALVWGQVMSASANEMFAPLEKEVILNAKNIEISSEYAPTSSDNVDISLSPTPSERIRDWIAKHFKVTAQGDNTVKFVVTNASILEEYVPPKGLSLSSTYKYKAAFTVKASVVNAQGEQVKSFISKVWGTKTIPDSSTIEERTDSLAELTDTLISSLADQISGGVQSTFQQYIERNIIN